ncbi:MAG: AMP-binding protein [Myxococcota bacterium]|nr:AMP-binding protein [Myxococcota bacterium]
MRLRIAAARIQPYRLRLSQPISGRTERSGWWVRLIDDAGRVGVGEAACWPGFGSSEDQVAAALSEVLAHVARIRTPGCIAQWTSGVPEARYAFELAVSDLMAQSNQIPLARYLAADATSSVPLSALVQSPADARKAVARGIQTLKIKLSDGDTSRVEAIRDAVGPDISIRVDANRCWPADTWQDIAHELSKVPVTVVEEPVADWAVLDKLPELQWAADETVRDQSSLQRILECGIADVIVIKPMFHGVLQAVELGRQAIRAGKRVIVTHALDSAVGCAGAAHIAAALGVTAGCGLAPALMDDPIEGLPQQDGRLLLNERPGLGVRLPGTAAGNDKEMLPEYSLPHPVETNAQARPSHAALKVDEHEVDWRTLCDRTRRAATAVMGLGIGPGDMVGLVPAPREGLVRDIHAISWTGAALAVPALAETQVAITDAAMAMEPAAERFWPLDEVRLRVSTSGTTGEPKVVDLTTGQLAFSAFGSAIRLGHLREDRWLCCLPFNHVGGLSVVYRTAFYATTMVLHDGFDRDAVNSALDSGSVTQVSLVPTMLHRLLEVRGNRPFHQNLRVVLLGGAPASDDLLKAALAAAVPVATTYGMTETASQVATSAPGVIRPAGEIGPPLPFVRVSTRGPCLTVHGPVARGTVVSNDRGYANRGIVRVEGRADDVILSGGELVDPLRVESVLMAHDGVLEAAVIGVLDLDWGQRVEAVVVTTTEQTEELREWCRERLDRFEVPKRIHLVDGIPRGPLGKVSRARVRAILAQNEERENGRARADA